MEEGRVKVTAAFLKPLIVNLIRVSQSLADDPSPKRIIHLKLWCEAAELALEGRQFEVPQFDGNEK